MIGLLGTFKPSLPMVMVAPDVGGLSSAEAVFIASIPRKISLKNDTFVGQQASRGS
jgi:hypothetical protein